MIVSNSAPLNGPEMQKSNASPSPVRPAEAGHDVSNQDQVALSPAGASALSNRSERIAELKTLVNSSSYSPSATEISKKLVSEALSRPADQG